LFDGWHKTVTCLACMNICQIVTLVGVQLLRVKESQAIAGCIITVVLNTVHYLQTHTNAFTIEVTCL
jgi:hypothetical protein